MSADRWSVAQSAVASAAEQLGAPQLQRLAAELIGVEVDRLTEWFEGAAIVGRSLVRGAGRLSDAIGPLAAG